MPFSLSLPLPSWTGPGQEFRLGEIRKKKPKGQRVKVRGGGGKRGEGKAESYSKIFFKKLLWSGRKKGGTKREEVKKVEDMVK